MPPSPRSGKRRKAAETLSIRALDAFDTFFTDLYDACEAMDIPADTTTSETGLGQFEVNLMHCDDALRAADDAWLFKMLVKGLARRHGFAASFIALFVLRMAVGALEAPAYPINSRVVTTWFPERERATAIGVYTSGQFVGLAFLTPVLAWLQHHYGWHMVFVVTGGVGILWAAIWYAVYREPKDFKGANAAEIELIREGGGLVDMQAKTVKAPFSWVDLGIVLSKRKLWGIYLGQFCLNSTLWFFLTWFPTYLVKYRGMDFIKSGLLASLPFLAAFVGVLCSGFFSDFLIRRGCTVGFARKLPIIGGLLISTSIIGANFVESTPLVIAFLALAFFGNGLASITWSRDTGLDR